MLIEQTIQDQLSPAFLETGARPFPRHKKAGSWGRAQALVKFSEVLISLGNAATAPPSE